MTNIYVVEDPSSLEDVKEGKNKVEPEITLSIIRNKNIMNFDLQDKNGYYYGPYVKEFANEEIKNMLIELDNKLALLSSRKYSDENIKEKKAFLFNFEGYARGLYKSLIPPEINKKLNKLKPGAIINITEHDDWIPWEILHNGQGYLGPRFVIFRLPRINDPKDFKGLSSKNLLNHVHNRSIKKLIHVIGGSIDQSDLTLAKDNFKDLVDKKLVEVDELEKKNLTDLLRKANEADILHFTCHGRDGYLQITEMEDPLINLDHNSFNLIDFKIKHGCLVFVNACSSAAAKITISGFTNFGVGFFMKGSRIFIGTLGSVPTVFAINFANTFYNNLFKSKSISDALFKTKREMKRKGDIYQIMYVLYGNPKDGCQLYN